MGTGLFGFSFPPLPKPLVAGSIPVSRSSFRRFSQSRLDWYSDWYIPQRLTDSVFYELWLK